MEYSVGLAVLVVQVDKASLIGKENAYSSSWSVCRSSLLQTRLHRRSLHGLRFQATALVVLALDQRPNTPCLSNMAYILPHQILVTCLELPLNHKTVTVPPLLRLAAIIRTITVLYHRLPDHMAIIQCPLPIISLHHQINNNSHIRLVLALNHSTSISNSINNHDKVVYRNRLCLLVGNHLHHHLVHLRQVSKISLV